MLRAPYITRILDRLEKRELMERIRMSGDRRQVLVKIAPAGRALLKKIAKPLKNATSNSWATFESKMKQLRDLLQEARRPHEQETSPWRVDAKDA